MLGPPGLCQLCVFLTNLLRSLESKELGTATVALCGKVKPLFPSSVDTGDSTILLVKTKSRVNTGPKFHVTQMLAVRPQAATESTGILCSVTTLPCTPFFLSFFFFVKEIDVLPRL